jgi:hypothetical protein
MKLRKEKLKMKKFIKGNRRKRKEIENSKMKINTFII